MPKGQDVTSLRIDAFAGGSRASRHSASMLSQEAHAFGGGLVGEAEGWLCGVAVRLSARRPFSNALGGARGSLQGPLIDLTPKSLVFRCFPVQLGSQGPMDRPGLGLRPIWTEFWPRGPILRILRGLKG